MNSEPRTKIEKTYIHCSICITINTQNDSNVTATAKVLSKTVSNNSKKNITKNTLRDQ